jgi:hypothetical protein
MYVKRNLAALAVAFCAAAVPLRSSAAVFVSVRIAPPALPVYDQPVCPGDDYIWTPGYWQWDPQVSDYYWVPGTWVMAPQTGYLWTPGYWGFENSAYLWHGGYWGPHIGFYGGVNYGFGYFGSGFAGGYWNGPHFFYNTSISHVNVNIIHNTYVHNVTVINNTHVAFNGPGGVNARPTAGEQAAFHENHVAPTGVQMQHASFAEHDRGQFASTNHGVPPAAAMARPAQSQNAFHANAAPARAAGGPMNTAPGGGGFHGNTNVAPQQRGFAGGGPVNSQSGNRIGAQDTLTSHPAARPTTHPQTQQQARPQEARPAPQARQAQAHPAPHAEEHR